MSSASTSSAPKSLDDIPASLPRIFDRTLYLQRQAKASAAQQPLLAHVAGELAERLSLINHRFETVALVAIHPHDFQQVLEASGKCGTIAHLAPRESDNLGLAPLAYDAVFNMLDLHCVNDVPGHLAQCARCLKADGLFISVCFAGETLAELRQAWLTAETNITGGVSPRVAPMIGVREMGGLLQRVGLALPVADVEQLVLRYADPLALLREIKAFGFANPLADRSHNFTTRHLLAQLCEVYAGENAESDGRIHATLDLLWAVGWKPHDSQPKPKKPGSATARLTDVLKAFDNGG